MSLTTPTVTTFPTFSPTFSPSSASSIPQKISITICGDGGCGKSSITLRLVRSHWTHEYDPTIEDSYSITRRIDGQTYHLSLTDTAGQEEYRGMWAASNLRSDAFLLVYDITNEHSLDVLEEFNTLIDIEKETRLDAFQSRRARAHSSPRKRSRSKPQPHQPSNDHDLHPFIPPIKIVAGNKCDLAQSRRVPAQVGLEWARSRGCGFMETSARNTVNIEETFALIVRRVVEARREAARVVVEDGALRGGGGGGDGGREEELADRRAVTAPLTPLPAGPEKEGYGFEDGGNRPARREVWWKRIGRRLRCW